VRAGSAAPNRRHAGRADGGRYVQRPGVAADEQRRAGDQARAALEAQRCAAVVQRLGAGAQHFVDLRPVGRAAGQVHARAQLAHQPLAQARPGLGLPAVGGLAGADVDDDAQLARGQRLGGLDRQLPARGLRRTAEVLGELEVLLHGHARPRVGRDAPVGEHPAALLATRAVEAQAHGRAAGAHEEAALEDALQVDGQVEALGAQLAQERRPARARA
jgi:hypothetical protein